MGKDVTIFTREQRGKIEQFSGKIDKLYPTFFNIETATSQQVSFNYVDILTNEIVVRSKDNTVVIKNLPTSAKVEVENDFEEEDLF